MADTKLSDLPAITALATGDLLYVVDVSEVAVADQSKRLPVSLVDARYASAAQGALAATALQPAAIGVSVQAYAADLAAIAALSHADGNFIVGNGAAWVAESGATARASLGLGSAALAASGDFATAAQGALAATALQSGDVAAMAYVADAPSDNAYYTRRNAAWASLGAMALVADAPSDGSTYGRNNGAWAAVAAGVSLPVDDDTALVYRTGFAARTVSLNADALTAARVVALPDADFQPAGLALANVFTAAQTITPSADGATIFLVEQSGGADVFSINTTNPSVNVGSARIHTYGTRNTFAGAGAGNFTLTVASAINNTAIGVSALDVLSTGQDNVAIGYDALGACTDGDGNVAIGTQALLALTTGTYNFALGDATMQVVTTETNNVAIGRQAMTNLTGNRNVGIGTQALRGAAGVGIRSSNVGIGIQTGLGLTTGDNNIFIGDGAGLTDTTGGNNVMIGHNAGYLMSIGNGCVFIGYQAAYNETAGNLLYIANSNTATPLIYGNFATGLLKFHTADAGTATAPNTVSLVHLSSGTPAATFGASLRFGLESTTTEDQNAARLAGVWLDPTHASRTAEMVAYASDSAAEREIWRGRATGAAAAFAVLGQTPAVRQAHIVDADGTLADVTAKFNTLLGYLETFGFIATS